MSEFIKINWLIKIWMLIIFALSTDNRIINDSLDSLKVKMDYQRIEINY